MQFMPFRPDAERTLIGNPVTLETLRRAAEAEMKSARALEHNVYKIGFGKHAIVRALMRANGMA